MIENEAQEEPLESSLSAEEILDCDPMDVPDDSANRTVTDPDIVVRETPEINPDLTIDLDTTCPACGHTFQQSFEATL